MLITIEFIYFEEPPFSHDEPDRIASQYHDLPRPYLDALATVHDRVDSLLCARCGDPIGFVLDGDRDERVGWECLSLARHGDDPVTMLCQICSPWTPELDVTPDSSAIT